jgi:hypothetical protein
MKTSKTSNKSGKTSKDLGTVKSNKVTIINSVPSEEEIREKAKEIYHQRIDRGEYRTEVDDWLEAEECLKDSEG